MKYLLLSLMLLVGCSTDKETVFVAKGTPGGNGSSGVSCTTYPVEGGSNVKCGDSITFIANGSKGDVGVSGGNGLDGLSMGVDVSSLAPSCSNGGATVKSYVDSNKNSQLDEDESIKQVAIICNGTDGENGSSVSVTAANSEQCSTGGVVLTGGITICNGAKGDLGPVGPQGVVGPVGPRGEQGLVGGQGPQGISGLAGPAGSVGPVGPQGPAGINGSLGNITPVQLCPGDTGAFKEQGLVVNGDLFAVYFDKTSTSNYNPKAFLAKLNPGTYVTTNGSNCVFTYAKSSTELTLSNSSGTTKVPLNSNTGLLCNVHNLSSTNGSTVLPAALSGNTVVGSFVLANLSVGDSPSANGFPGMPANLQALVGLTDYALDCSGYLNIKTSGDYTLKLLSDDGARLSIEDSYLLVEDQGLHAPGTVSGTKLLNKGPNKFNIVYFQGPATQIALQLKISGPNMPETVVPASDFTH